MAGGAGHILIVEDEPEIAELLAALLTDEGYAAVVSVDGAAVETARTDPPGLILLDVLMPGMAGAAVCRRLKADPRTAPVPIVFLTALLPHALGARLGDCPHDGLLHKPSTWTSCSPWCSASWPEPPPCPACCARRHVRGGTTGGGGGVPAPLPARHPARPCAASSARRS